MSEEIKAGGSYHRPGTPPVLSVVPAVNPHDQTKEQVGLGNDQLGTATSTSSATPADTLGGTVSVESSSQAGTTSDVQGNGQPDSSTSQPNGQATDSTQDASGSSDPTSQPPISQTNASGATPSLIQKIEGDVKEVFQYLETGAKQFVESVEDTIGLGIAVGEAAATGESLNAAKPKLGNDASGASTATGASGTSAQGSDGVAAGNAQSGLSDGAGTTPPGTSATATGSSSSPSTPTIPPVTIVTGQPVNGSVVTNVPAPAPAPAAQSFIQKEESVVLNTIQTGITDVDRLVDELMKGTSIEAKIIINTIKEYIVTMKPGKPISQKLGVMQQVAFYNAVLGAINNLEADFRPTMQSILALFHAHKDGAFKETHVFRFMDTVPLSTEHRAGWRKITTLLKTLANPETRQTLLRQMNFDPLLKHGLSERGRTKLAAFFGK